MCDGNKLDQELGKQWIKWEMKLKHAESVLIPGCLKPVAFGRISEINISYFSDGSKHGYCQCSYIGLSLMMG